MVSEVIEHSTRFKVKVREIRYLKGMRRSSRLQNKQKKHVEVVANLEVKISATVDNHVSSTRKDDTCDKNASHNDEETERADPIKLLHDERKETAERQFCTRVSTDLKKEEKLRNEVGDLDTNMQKEEIVMVQSNKKKVISDKKKIVSEKQTEINNKNKNKKNGDQKKAQIDEQGGVPKKEGIMNTYVNHHTISDNNTTLNFKSKKEPNRRTSKFALDVSKYQSISVHQNMNNELLKTSLKLKNNLPFREHIRSLFNTDDVKGSTPDVFGLDRIQLEDSNSSKPRPASEINTDLNVSELYFDSTKGDLSKQNVNKSEVDAYMKKSVIPDDLERREKPPMLYESARSKKLERKKKSEETAGQGWYNLPKTELTEEVKRDLQLLKMRNVLDTKKHYKRNDSNKLPKYFQVGTIVEGAHEFYSTRVTKKHRKRTMVDELLDDAEFRRKNKKKLVEIRKKQASGGKGHFKKMKNKRKPTWART